MYFYYLKISKESFISTHFCPEFQQKQPNCLPPCISCLMATSSLPVSMHLQSGLDKTLWHSLSETRFTLFETHAQYSVCSRFVYNAENLLTVLVGFQSFKIAYSAKPHETKIHMKKELINSGFIIISRSSLSLPISKTVYW